MHDKPHYGRPKTAENVEYKERVNKLIRDKYRFKQTVIVRIVEISLGKTNGIIKDEL